VRLRALLLTIVSLAAIAVLSGLPRAVAEDLPWHVAPVPAKPAVPAAPASPSPTVPDWLQAHVGLGDGQIAPVVLQRARALYLKKTSEGAIDNPCYFAVDATRPAGTGRRFYVICEGDRTFRALPTGHGNGRNLKGIANFANGIRCAKHFSNAEDSKLTTGGSYVTAEIKTSFKGYYRAGGKTLPMMRSFVQFDGEGDTANARPRAIGGHPAVIVAWHCRMKAPRSPHADKEGYVPIGKLIDYSAGRSNGCTSWSPADAKQILAMVENRPATLYIYPESSDIVAVGRAVKAGQSPSKAGLYWNASCLKEIGVPNFWPREKLEPALMEYRKKNPPPKPQPLPICR
jgi:hypothetical protein